MAAGAAGEDTASREEDTEADRLSGRFDDLVGSDAAGAHAQPPDAAVDERTNPLEVRLEPTGPDVVRVTDDPADDRSLPADFTVLCHG